MYYKFRMRDMAVGTFNISLLKELESIQGMYEPSREVLVGTIHVEGRKFETLLRNISAGTIHCP